MTLINSNRLAIFVVPIVFISLFFVMLEVKEFGFTLVLSITLMILAGFLGDKEEEII